MKLVIKTFAALKEAIGQEVVLDIQQPVNIAGIKKLIADKYTVSTALIKQSRVAIDLQFVEADYVLTSDTEIYFIPPSSGG